MIGEAPEKVLDEMVMAHAKSTVAKFARSILEKIDPIIDVCTTPQEVNILRDVILLIQSEVKRVQEAK